MPYFDEDFLTFFKELSRNNHREWFQAHKSTYENKVWEPFLTLDYLWRALESRT